MASSPGIPNIPSNINSLVQMTKTGLLSANLAQGDMVTLAVVEKLPDNQYLINISGTIVTMKSDLPMEAGEKFQARIQNIQPELALQVIDPQRQSADIRSSDLSGQRSANAGSLIQASTRVLPTSGNQKASNEQPLQLSQGQTLNITVQEKLSGNQYQMKIKDVTLTVTSDIPLKEGDKLQVKVQSLDPRLILNVIDAQKQVPDVRINEKLVQWKINPDSLIQILPKTNAVVQNLQSINLPAGFSAKDVEALSTLMRNIVFSDKTKNNPSFIKDFVSQTGLMMEKDLAAIVSNRSSANILSTQDNLKTTLLKLQDVLGRVLQDSGKLDPAVTAKLMDAASFTSDALKTVEARQAVNLVYQQNENGLYLQIPLATGDHLRQADIFITPDDKKAQGAKKFTSCSVRIFLDLDYLGEISVEASLREGRIRCLIHCESEDVRKLVEDASGQLRDALSGIGYQVDHLDCLEASDLKSKRIEFVDQQILGSADLVNSFV
jgi:hypothetical protein